MKQRDLPIISLMEMLRKKIDEEIPKEVFIKMDGRICPKFLEWLDKLSRDTGHCNGVYAGDEFFEVTDK